MKKSKELPKRVVGKGFLPNGNFGTLNYELREINNAEKQMYVLMTSDWKKHPIKMSIEIQYMEKFLKQEDFAPFQEV